MIKNYQLARVVVAVVFDDHHKSGIFAIYLWGGFLLRLTDFRLSFTFRIYLRFTEELPHHNGICLR